MVEEEEGEEDVCTNRRAAAGPLMARITSAGFQPAASDGMLLMGV